MHVYIIIIIAISYCNTFAHIYTPCTPGARNQLKLVRVHEAHYIRDKYTEEPPTPADVDFLRQARCVIHQYNMSMPTNVKEAIKFYINLWTILENE